VRRSAKGRITVALIRWCACILLATALLPAAASAQSPELLDALSDASDLNAQKKHQEAVPYVEEAARLAENEFGSGHPFVSKLLSYLAGLYVAQQHYSDAEPLYLRALQIREDAFGRHHPDLAVSLSELGLNYQA